MARTPSKSAILAILAVLGAFLVTPTPANDRRIRLRAGPFDPRLDAPPDFRDRLPTGSPLRPAAEAGPQPWLLQLDVPVSAAVRSELGSLGVRVLRYVPSRTLLIRLPPGKDAATVRRAVGGVFVGPYQQGYRLAPELARLCEDGAESGLRRALTVTVTRDADPQALARAIETVYAGAKVRWIRQRDPMQIVLDLEPGTLVDLVGSLIADPAVEWVEERRPPELHNDHAAWIGQSYDRIGGPAEAAEADPKPYSLSGTIWNRGLTGEGQVVAVLDTGLDYGNCFFADPGRPVVPQYVASTDPDPSLTVDPLHRKVLAFNQPGSGAPNGDGLVRHGTHVSGSVAGDSLTHPSIDGVLGHDRGDGMAPGAKIVFQDVGSPAPGACVSSISVPHGVFEQSYAAGARIATNSYGGPGPVYGSQAAWLDSVTWAHEDFLLLFSAGNSSTQGINSWSVCKNCITVGASENYDPDWSDVHGILDPENVVAFSSLGPAADGRIKPDLMAPGFFVESNNYPLSYFDPEEPECEPAPNVCYLNNLCGLYDPGETCHVGRLLGTSMSTPITAGFAALARQYFTEGFYPGGEPNLADAMVPSAALLKAVLLNGARNMTGRRFERRGTPVDYGPLPDAPSGKQGWGRVHLDDALYFPGDTRKLRVDDVANADGLSTGQESQVSIVVTDPAESLSITLAWTDPPVAGSAETALVNDLDLELLAPDGTLYRGNQWTTDDVEVPGDKQSASDPTGRDAIDNVEGIRIPSPLPGSYLVTVRGAEVPGYDSLDTQGYALAINGAFALPSSAPPPVPDGTFGTQMLATRDDGSGKVIGLTWDVETCPAADYHVVYGPLSGVASHTVSGGACALGIGGTHAWSGVPAESLWFVLVSEAADGTEGTWGTASNTAPRGGELASGQCGATERINLAGCP